MSVARPSSAGLAALLCLAGACASPAADPSTVLHELFDREWEQRLLDDPLFATSVGRHEYDDRLPSVAEADLRQAADRDRTLLEELLAIDRATLPDAERVSYDIFRRELELRIADVEFGSWQIPINSDSGFHSAFAGLPSQLAFRSTDDYENYLDRLRAFPAYVEQQIANMRLGLERGMSLPRVVLDGYDVTIESHVVDDVENSVFWAPFRGFPEAVPAADRERLRTAARAAIAEGAVAGYRAFLEFMLSDYLPRTRRSLGASELPDGAAYYAHLIRSFTTLDLTADEIHRIGLEEVARIRAEMGQVMDEVGFRGDLAAFLTFLRTDPRFYAETPQELLMYASWCAKRIDGKLPSLFGRLPRLPYGVEPVPDHIAPKYTGGRYVPAPRGGTRAGTYWVNTYALENRPLYVLEALTLHEAVPGHHLQIALNNEIEDLPNFRRYSYISAFGEGWGLYSERLGLEAGFYEDPYSDFGRLTYEMWRACRLVVDTGIHAMGWTREQAVEYLASNTALSLHEVGTEIDRYISWPGQALSYKLGELKIRELRTRAEEALGPRFDLRGFHDAVLGNGSVPLGVLEDSIDAWIVNESRTSP